MPATDVILNFNDLSAGDIVGSQFLRDGVLISSGQSGNPPMIFDADNPTGEDGDLGVSGFGNLLIISEDGDTSDPDDNAGGGSLIFDFTTPSTVTSLSVVDIEVVGIIELFDASGTLIDTIALPDVGDGQAGEVSVGVDNVSKMVVTLSGSGAIDNIAYTTSGAPDGIVEGTEDDDLIDAVYTGDPENDRIDAGDAVLDGEAPDDDIVLAGGGNDTVIAGAGSDTVYGEDGNDTVIGGAGADTLIGGADRDLFIVGSQQDGIGDVIDGSDGGDDNDTLDLTGAGPFNILYSSDDEEDGTVEFLAGPGSTAVIGSLSFTEIENIVPCFTPGTSIATPRGEILVEDLQVGDKVITRDNGIQEVRWTGSKIVDAAALLDSPHLRPILVPKGSLGNDLPERDMLVSPNHRLLVNNDRVSLYFDENEVLVAAKHLVSQQQGVHSVQTQGATYIHFMFDKHEVVLGNGAWTESFQPGDYSLKGLGNSQRNEIFELFPDLKGAKGREAYASARLTLKKKEAKILFK